MKILKSYNFALIEVVISLFVVGMCLLPMMSQPFHLIKKEHRLLAQIEAERLFELEYAGVLKELEGVAMDGKRMEWEPLVIALPGGFEGSYPMWLKVKKQAVGETGLALVTFTFECEGLGEKRVKREYQVFLNLS
ncbi:MAG: hypothetical protein S4CHLAM102_00660 [Chlamydiia bacterium]|nr:hypothetical protein [Chlamydiia bacterium]